MPYDTEKKTLPYPPGKPTVEIVRRIHEGRAGSGPLTAPTLQQMGIAEGNADRVQRGLIHLGLIDADTFDFTDVATRLRRSNPDEYPQELAGLVRSAYGEIFDIIADPAEASGLDLDRAFHVYDPAGQRKNMIGLFLALCREAQLVPEADTNTRGRPPGSRSTIRSGNPNKGTIRPGNKGAAGGTPPPPPPPNDGVLFHPSIDSFLREAKKLTQGEAWDRDARDHFIQAFTTMLDLFLPAKETGTR